MRFMQKRQEIAEGFNPFSCNVDCELAKINSTVVVGIRNASTTNLPLTQYCIKASYNSAYSWSTVNVKMITYVLTRGCRFLDFQVSLGLDDNKQPKVYVGTGLSQSTMLIGDVFNEIVKSAFNSPSPNAKDPLFIQFRIDSTNNDIYELLGINIRSILLSYLYLTQVVPTTTTLDDIGSKIVLIMDKNTTYDYTDASYYKSQGNNLRNLIMLESGNNRPLSTYAYTALPMLAITVPVNAHMKIAKPAINSTANPFIKNFITLYGCQITACQFYINDNALQHYESLFASNSTAFIPFDLAIQSQ